MSKDFVIKAGLPFRRRLRMVGQKTRWSDLGDFEVRCQLRKASSPRSALIANLHDYMTKSYGVVDGDSDQTNDIIILWSMTGAETLAINEDGYYDLVVSDIGAEDIDGIVILDGVIEFESTTTKPEGVT